MKNYYKILGVANAANITQIKKAYHKRVKETHPDSNQSDPYANEKMAELNEVFETLSNPVKRQNYDSIFNQDNDSAVPNDSNNEKDSSTEANTSSSNWKNWKKWAVAISILLIIAFFNSNSNNNTTDAISTTSPTLKVKHITPTTKPTPTPTPIPTATPTPTPTPAPVSLSSVQQYYQAVTVDEVSKYPSNYLNKQITFTCYILSFAKDSNGDATGINCTDPNNPNSFLMIDASTFDVSKMNNYDAITVYGFGQGAFTSTNAYGGDVTESEVSGIYVIDSTSGYSDTVAYISP